MCRVCIEHVEPYQLVASICCALLLCNAIENES